MHATTYITRATRAVAEASDDGRTRWIDVSEDPASILTLFFPREDAELVAACNVLTDAIDAIRRGALDRMAVKVKADQAAMPDLPEDAVCEDPDLGTWSPGELVEAYGS